MHLSGIGPYVEVAFYHKRSRTLLVTDAVIFVPRQPPECISKESLLASAKNGLAVKILSKGKEVPQEPVVDNKLNRQKGQFSILNSIENLFASEFEYGADAVQRNGLVYVRKSVNGTNFLCRVGKNGSPNLISWSIKPLGTQC